MVGPLPVLTCPPLLILTHQDPYPIASTAAGPSIWTVFTNALPPVPWVGPTFFLTFKPNIIHHLL